MFPLEKYIYVVDGREIKALQTYAGRVYVGIAKCAPQDEFDFETGKELAAARCNYKIARARCQAARFKFRDARIQALKAQQLCEKYRSFYDDAYDAMIEAGYELEELEDANGVES